MHPIAAIIYLPSAISLSSVLAQHCIDHLERRGYELKAVVHEWSDIVQMLRSGRAQVVIFARQEHVDPSWAPRFEFVGHDTRDLSKYGRTRPRNDRHNERPGDSRTRRPRLAN